MFLPCLYLPSFYLPCLFLFYLTHTFHFSEAFINIQPFDKYPLYLYNKKPQNHLPGFFIKTKNIIIPHMKKYDKINKKIDMLEEKKERKPINKINSFLKLIRYKNLFPTFLLSLSGGFLIKGSLYDLFSSPSFIGASINTLLIMSTSMVINDIFDIEVDKINHPERPLISGEISIPEAAFFSGGLLGISEYINVALIPESLRIITHLSILNIILYTPFFKKIFLFKNIFCASLVSFSLFFAGLSSTNQYLPLHENFGIFSLVLTFIFMGSFYNELLLDMRDYEGDKQNKIITFPVVFGKKNAWILSNGILGFSTFCNLFALTHLFNIYVACVFLFISCPMFSRSFKIKRENFSKESIVSTVNETNQQLFLLLIYYCSLAFLK